MALLVLAAPASAVVDLPERAPIPEASPRKAEPRARNGAPPVPAPRPEHEARKAAAPQSGGPPAHERACRAGLRALGVEYVARETIAEDEGCAIAWPISVRSLSADVALIPAATLNCAMAEAAARFVQEVVVPTARQHLGAEPETIRHASAYVCRSRSGAGELSEHAFGNALDISRIDLADGTLVEVRRHKDEDRRRFQSEIRDKACGLFKTVLGPGTDADHAGHFHFDLAKRRGGATYCR